MALFSTTPLPRKVRVLAWEQKEGSQTRYCLPGTPDTGALAQLRIILDRTITTPESTDKKNLQHRAESRVNFHRQTTPRDQTNCTASCYTTAAHRPASSIQRSALWPWGKGAQTPGQEHLPGGYQHTWTRPLGSTQQE